MTHLVLFTKPFTPTAKTKHWTNFCPHYQLSVRVGNLNGYGNGREFWANLRRTIVSANQCLTPPIMIPSAA